MALTHVGGVHLRGGAPRPPGAAQRPHPARRTRRTVRPRQKHLDLVTGGGVEGGGLPPGQLGAVLPEGGGQSPPPGACAAQTHDLHRALPAGAAHQTQPGPSAQRRASGLRGLKGGRRPFPPAQTPHSQRWSGWRGEMQRQGGGRHVPEVAQRLMARAGRRGVRPCLPGQRAQHALPSGAAGLPRTSPAPRVRPGPWAWAATPRCSLQWDPARVLGLCPAPPLPLAANRGGLTAVRCLRTGSGLARPARRRAGRGQAQHGTQQVQHRHHEVGHAPAPPCTTPVQWARGPSGAAAFRVSSPATASSTGRLQTRQGREQTTHWLGSFTSSTSGLPVQRGQVLPGVCSGRAEEAGVFECETPVGPATAPHKPHALEHSIDQLTLPRHFTLHFILEVCTAEGAVEGRAGRRLRALVSPQTHLARWKAAPLQRAGACGGWRTSAPGDLHVWSWAAAGSQARAVASRVADC